MSADKTPAQQLPTPLRLLVIGSGELGMAVLRAVTQPQYHSLIHSTLMCRDPTAQTPQLNECRALNITLTHGDVNAGIPALTTALAAANPHTVISCVGYNIPADGQRQIAQACINTGTVQRYLPWEFGFPYELVGYGSPQPIFDEKLITRQLVQQSGLDYIFLSCGLFCDFLFSDSFGVVDRAKRTVTAPGSFQHRMSTTCLDDIGAMTARLLLDPAVTRQTVRIQGDTITYEDVAKIMEVVTGEKYERVVLSIESLQERAAKDEKDVDARYHLVMAKQDGIHYELSTTYNFQNGIRLQTAREWAEKHLRKTEVSAKDISQ